jgi:hypothetical protein
MDKYIKLPFIMGNWYVSEEKNITRSLIDFVNFPFINVSDIYINTCNSFT